MAQTPIEPGTELVLLVDREAETVEIFLSRPTSPSANTLEFIAMSGELDSLEQVRWLASSCATFHNIPFRVEQAES